jgi:hypothetical protein
LLPDVLISAENNNRVIESDLSKPVGTLLVGSIGADMAALCLLNPLLAAFFMSLQIHFDCEFHPHYCLGVPDVEMIGDAVDHTPHEARALRDVVPIPPNILLLELAGDCSSVTSVTWLSSRDLLRPV